MSTEDKKSIFFNMRFSGADIQLYEAGKKLAQKRRISFAELMRSLLIAELDKDKPSA